MTDEKSNIKNNYQIESHKLSNLQQDKDKLFFGEKIIIMHGNRQMLQHTIGDGTPHRLHNMRIGIYTQGQMDCLINMQEQHLHQGMLEFYASGTIFQLNQASPDLNVLEIIFDPSLASELLGGNLPHLFGLYSSSHNIAISPDEQTNLCQMMQLALNLVKTEGELAPTTRSIVQAILRYTLSLFRKHLKQHQDNISRQEIIFREFSHLVALSHGQQRRHRYYADKLNVSEHYLSLTVKKISGVTAKEWIDRVVIAEIKILLVHTDLTIAQITHKLEFPTDSFLCKFFRRHTSMSPLEFRKTYR